MGTFMYNLLGGLTIAMFLGAFFWSLWGVAISLLLDAATRKPLSTTSPVPFSWKFLLRDNWKRIFLVLMVLIATIRFCPTVTGKPLSMELAFIFGIGYDFLVGLWKKKAEFLKVPVSNSENKIA